MAADRVDTQLRVRCLEVFRQFSAVLVFAIALPLLWLRLGHWFYLSIDEGIYLEGARRVARGEVPYRDFFTLTGPGTFWLYGAAFHLFGVSLACARFVLCLELAVMCATVCRLVGRFTGAAFAAASSLLFLAMLLTTVYPLYITHRWDSNTAALLAVACVCAADASALRGNRWSFVAGLFAGIAMWATPPLAFVALALALWIAIAGKNERGVWWYVAGVAAPSAIAVSVLFYQGAIPGMVQSLVWDASNYAAANRLAYGALAGNFQGFWHSGSAGIVHLADSALPVLLPPLAVIAALARRGNTRLTWLLCATSVASLLACYPRFGAAQLLFGTAFCWVLFSVSVSEFLTRHRDTTFALAALILAVVAVVAGWPRDLLKPIETPVGILRVSRLHFVQLNDLLASVKPGDGLFVYPYLPALYFALGGENPTRYSWLQPGMMEPHDVQNVLTALRTRPPRWIVWHDFTEEFILKNWPASDGTRLRFPAVENYFQTNYHAVTPDGVVPTGYRLLEKNQ